jgi:hypothetical protein
MKVRNSRNEYKLFLINEMMPAIPLAGLDRTVGANPLGETVCILTVCRWLKNGVHFVGSPAD